MIRTRPTRARLHWLYFVPLCAAVLLLVESHTVRYAFLILKLGYQRWTWGALISPSAAFCLAVVVASVLLPLQGLAVVYGIVTSELKVKQRTLYSVLVIVAIFVMPFVAEALLWGSFPFIFDDEGVSRLRMIPFIPWPSGHYGEY
jgi:hypothetical protein